MVWAILTDYNHNLCALTEILDQETSVIGATVKADPGAEAMNYHSHDGLVSDTAIQLATAGSKNAKTGLYGTIALINFDHFGLDAIATYKAGHQVAIEIAQAAAKLSDKGAQQRKLNEAYLNDAAACHYLTDLFSTGHARTPRRALHYSDWTSMVAAKAADANVWDNMCEVCHGKYVHFMMKSD